MFNKDNDIDSIWQMRIIESDFCNGPIIFRKSVETSKDVTGHAVNDNSKGVMFKSVY